MRHDVGIASVGINLASRLNVAVLKVIKQDVCLLACKIVLLDVSGSGFASLLVLCVLGSGCLEGVPLLGSGLVSLVEFFERREAFPSLERCLVCINIYIVGNQLFVFDIGCLCCNDSTEDAGEIVKVDHVIAINSPVDNASFAVGQRTILFTENLMPCRIDECLSVQQPAGLAAFKLAFINQDRCVAACCADTVCAVGKLAEIAAVGNGSVVAIEGSEELAELLICSADCADGQAALDVHCCGVAVTDDTAKGAAAGLLVEVDDLAVEQTVADDNDVVDVAVGIAQHAAVVTAVASIVAVERAGVDAVLDGGLIVCIVDHCCTKDASLSAASACVVDVHKAVDVADCWVDVAGVCCHAACICSSDVIRSVDVEVLDDAV